MGKQRITTQGHNRPGKRSKGVLRRGSESIRQSVGSETTPTATRFNNFEDARLDAKKHHRQLGLSLPDLSWYSASRALLETLGAIDIQEP
jgi:hypothetical protein